MRLDQRGCLVGRTLADERRQSHGPLLQSWDYVLVIIPSLVIGAITWLTFHFAVNMLDWLTPAKLNVIERLAGFLLAGLAIDMMAAGLKELFPLLAS